MNDLTAFLENMNWWGLVDLLVSAAAALFCITFHELSHGLTAYSLGDPTAQRAGRLTLNPLAHIDPVGLLMMVAAKVGWAKPVPVDMRYFKSPKRDMAITALAGPLSNFLLAGLAVGGDALLYRFSDLGTPALVCMCALSNVAILSLGLGLFNLIPIPPLDGSKVLFSVLPDRTYLTILRYERYIMLAVVLLTMSGVLSRPLSAAITWLLSRLCDLTGCPLGAVLVTSDIANLMELLK